MKQDRRRSSLLMCILAVCFFGQAAIQRSLFPLWEKDFAPRNNVGNAVGLTPDELLFAFTGFREMIAGILWVRADAFFDTGNYDAILPIIRLVTILDPQEIDVYATGMWHIGYNFTDEEQRSDRRYIPSALALGAEGCKQNPNTYELFFETGWLWFHKIDDYYDNAVDWFLKAQQRKDMILIPARRDLLGMAYQHDNKPMDALMTYLRLHDDAEKNETKDFSSHQIAETLEGNADNTMVRMVQRGYIAETQHRPLNDYDVYPPFDVGFSVKATVVESRKIVFEGTWLVRPVGTRIRVVLKDSNFKHGTPAGMVWDFSKDVNLDPPRDETFMQDQLFVKNQRFLHKVDMSKDPTMYPFTTDTYDLEFYYNPQSAPPHIQDKFSWGGEGMTDKHFLNLSVRPGERVIYEKLSLTRDQILRRGYWRDHVPVVKSPNYVETNRTYDKDSTIIDIPALRSSGK